MNILAFELANFSCSIALSVKGEVVAFHQSDEYKGQDATLIPQINHMLIHNGLSFQQLDRIVTTTGPGSFTGIRVALATAQGLELAASVPAFALNSLEWTVQ